MTGLNAGAILCGLAPVTIMPFALMPSSGSWPVTGRSGESSRGRGGAGFGVILRMLAHMAPPTQGRRRVDEGATGGREGVEQGTGVTDRGVATPRHGAQPQARDPQSRRAKVA